MPTTLSLQTRLVIVGYTRDSPYVRVNKSGQMVLAQVARMIRSKFRCVDKDCSHQKMNRSIFIVAILPAKMLQRNMAKSKLGD